MFYIFFVILLFIVSVAIHIILCRNTKKTGLHAKAFGLIAIVSLCIYTAGALALPYPGFKITAGIIFILLVPVYLCFYVLTQLTSPSKKILLAISQRGEASHSDILGIVQAEDFITTRLSDLCASGCVTQINGRYSLTAEGRKIALVLNMMQYILGRNAGG